MSNRSVDTRTALATASYITLVAPLLGMLPVCTFRSMPWDGLFGSIMESVAKAFWLVPNDVAFVLVVSTGVVIAVARGDTGVFVGWLVGIVRSQLLKRKEYST